MVIKRQSSTPLFEFSLTIPRVNAISFQSVAPAPPTFASEVKDRVNQYFEQNHLSKHANGAMIVKTVVLLVAYFGSYALILSGHLPLPVMAALCVAMGVAMAGIGFCVAHDALHGAYSANPRVNRVLGYGFDVLGANSYLWKITHNFIHHTYTNIQGFDEDLEVSPIIRLSPHTPYRPIHRAQHVLAFMSYSLATLFWVFAKDYKYFLQRDLGPYLNKKHPKQEWAILVVGKILYYLLMIALPLVLLDITWWQFLIGFLIVHLTAGLILGVVFQLAHVVETTEQFPGDAAKSMKKDWAVHQMRTTNDFARGNRLLSWYIGGLNYQIEHHLFPRICHVHYHKLSPIVQELAIKHHVPYHYHESFMEAVASHYRTLRQFADANYHAPMAVSSSAR